MFFNRWYCKIQKPLTLAILGALPGLTICLLFLSSSFLFIPRLVKAGAQSIADSGKRSAGISGYHIAKLQVDPAGLKWVDSVMKGMSLEDKVGSLFMMAVLSNQSPSYQQTIASRIRDYHIGGLLFLRGGPSRQSIALNYYQSISKIPLLVSIDAETGLGMRLDSTMTFPHEMALGAIRDNSLIYKMGLEIARQCRLIGIQMDMAPVIDVNANQYNPIINERSFGESKLNVAAKGIAYMKGLQDGGVLAVAKHFPGHGESIEDSHITLPLIDRTALQIDSVELYPFRKLIGEGLSGVMTGHLNIPALDPNSNMASSLSPTIVTGLLKTKLGFSGLAITDAMNMKGVARFYPPGQRDLRALLAGNDIILFSEDIPRAFESVLHAVETGGVSMVSLDSKVRKILTAKYLTGLNNWRALSLRSLHANLNTPYAYFLKQELIQKALTVPVNAGHLIPLSTLSDYKIAAISIGQVANNTFQRTLNRYSHVSEFSTFIDGADSDYKKIEDSVQHYNTVIIALHNLEKSDKENYGIRGNTRDFVARLQSKKKVILVVFGNPYMLSNFAGLKNVIVAYNDTYEAESLSAQLIFGAIGADGRLPVTASPQFKIGSGEQIAALNRVKYTMPEDAGIRSENLRRVDSIARDGVIRKAYPGCVVVALKDGKMIYEKAFGTHTYSDNKPVLVTDLFDLASVTKITSTVLATMKLLDQGLIDVKKPLSFYLPETVNTNKKNIILTDLLTHQAGLVPFIPFYKEAMHEPGVFSPDSSQAYPVRVADHMYQKGSYFKDVMWKQVLESPLKTPGKYIYSDLSMYLMRAVVEKVGNDKLDHYAMKNFYGPLGLSTMGFNPRNRFSLDRIMPTEYDQVWRKQLVHGDVHDQGAAMQGGVAGHAGLFSDANDLAVVGQMLLQKGEYAGRLYIRPGTVEFFNQRPYPLTSRRGMGFDKPEKDPQMYPGSKYMSDEAFGHTGFTGTCIWIDPKYNLVYVFLSNRICPNAENTLLSALNIRSKIQNVFYEAIQKGMN